jgi:cbb3-type cytochrome oxidase subunit 3
MQVPQLGIDFVTALRVVTMLVFIAIFVGIVAWLLTPSGRRRTQAQGLDILRDDDPHSEDRR